MSVDIDVSPCVVATPSGKMMLTNAPSFFGRIRHNNCWLYSPKAAAVESMTAPPPLTHRDRARKTPLQAGHKGCSSETGSRPESRPRQQ